MPGEPAHDDTIDTPPPRRSPKSVLVSWLIATGAIIALLLVIRWTRIVESVAFFAPSSAAFTTPAGIDDLTLQGPNGGDIHAWRLPVPQGIPRRGKVLFCHGNAGHLPDHLAFVDRLPGMGFEVVLFDYRGFGRSTGRSRVNRASLMADSRAVADAMNEIYPGEPLLLVGHSMGGVMAINLAAERPDRFAAVAAVAPFASFPRVAADFAGPLGWVLVSGGLAAEQAATRLGQTPLLIVHGSADTIVQAYHSERIALAARDSAVSVSLVPMDGADHVNIFDPPYDAQRRIAEFFSNQLD